MRNQKGITLVVLVITVIIVVIISTVTIFTIVGEEGVLNSGRLYLEENALRQVKEDIKNEITKRAVEVRQMYQREINDTEIEIAANNNGCSYDPNTGIITVTSGDAINSTFPLSEIWNTEAKVRAKSRLLADLYEKEIQKGEYVNFIPVAQESVVVEKTYNGYSEDQAITKESLLWRVLDKQGDKIRLISETPTIQKIKMMGAYGYDNGVYNTNNVCEKLYSGELGQTKNIQIEDWQEAMDLAVWDYKTYGSYLQYGKTQTYATQYFYPAFMQYENYITVDGTTGSTYTKDDRSKQDNLYKGTAYLRNTSTLTLTQTYWYKKFAAENFINSKDYELFIKDPVLGNYPDYYISTRILGVDTGISYGLMQLMNEGTGFAKFFERGGGGYQCELPVRPIVTLNTNVQLVEDNPGNGSKTNPWKIKKAE